MKSKDTPIGSEIYLFSNILSEAIISNGIFPVPFIFPSVKSDPAPLLRKFSGSNLDNILKRAIGKNKILLK